MPSAYSQLSEAQKERRRASARKYYKKNRRFIRYAEKVEREIESPEKRKERLARARAYHEAHKEEQAAKKKVYNKERGRYLRRKKRLRGKRCMFCGIPLHSKVADSKVSTKGKSRTRITKYCRSCPRTKKVKRYLHALYKRRMRQKKRRQKREPISYYDPT